MTVPIDFQKARGCPSFLIWMEICAAFSMSSNPIHKLRRIRIYEN